MHETLFWVGSVVVSGIFSLIGWIFKMVFDGLKDHDKRHDILSKRISDHKLHVAENFATKKDIEQSFDRVMTKLDKIEDKFDRFDEKLEKKVDKDA